jgi:hypothetical protein
LIASTHSGEILGCLEGATPGNRLGESAVPRNLDERVIGAAGNGEIGGAVYPLRLDDLNSKEVRSLRDSGLKPRHDRAIVLA